MLRNWEGCMAEITALAGDREIIINISEAGAGGYTEKTGFLDTQGAKSATT
jgi:hypothetical protein